MSDERDPGDGAESLSDPTESMPPHGRPSEQIGPYKLREKIGEGGMGQVWLAEQTKPVRRKVALKVIKRGMDTKEVITRFEAERQTLALMDHPAIAKVFDAGETQRGRPYFVMEHVKGVPLTEHCDRQRLTTRERLDLFLQVCEGVQHAHHKAIIHRDLKPSNVLVALQDGKAVPKIIDFGVAKATAQRLTEKTLYTELGVMIGTPAYMSPEQAEMTGQDVDTRTDVYSLGVMLYELLVGALPFDPWELRRAGFAEIVRRIREDEPSKPSTRLSTLGERATESSKRRRTSLPALRRELSGDLDWITMKALEKDRGRRYGSPAELAADIRRHLDNQPVLASPPSAAYRARKFVRRHAIGVGVAVAVVIVLAVFAVAMAVQAQRIATERDAAQRAQADLESVVEFQAGMLSATDPQAMGRRLIVNISQRVAEQQRSSGRTEADVAAAMTVLEEQIGAISATDVALDMVDQDILGRAVETLDEKFGDRPEIDARLRHTIGEAYGRLGRHERGESQLVRALEIRKRVLGEEHPDTLSSMNRLGIVYLSQGRYAEAESLWVATLEARKRVLGEEHSDTIGTMNNLGVLYRRQGRSAEAEALHVAILEATKRLFGEERPETLSAMNNLANLYMNQARHAEAEPLHVATLEATKRLLGEEHPDTLSSMTNLAVLYRAQGRYAEAEPLFLATIEARKRVHGEEHPGTLVAMSNLALLYWNQGRFDQAEMLYVATLEANKRVRGKQHGETLRAMNNLANLYSDQGRTAEARPLVERALAAWRDQAETGPASAANQYAWLALTCEPPDLRDPQSALKFALAANEQTEYGDWRYLQTLALAYHQTGDTRKAIATQKKALSLLPDGESAARTELEERLIEFEQALTH